MGVGVGGGASVGGTAGGVSTPGAVLAAGAAVARGIRTTFLRLLRVTGFAGGAPAVPGCCTTVVVVTSGCGVLGAVAAGCAGGVAGGANSCCPVAAVAGFLRRGAFVPLVAGAGDFAGGGFPAPGCCMPTVLVDPTAPVAPVLPLAALVVFLGLVINYHSFRWFFCLFN